MNKMTKKIILMATAISFFLAFSMYATVGPIHLNNPKKAPPVGIVSAMRLETTYLKSQIKNTRIKKIFGRDYYLGQLNGRNVVVAQVGIGAVNAAVGTAILIKEFLPSAIIITGVAGGTNKTAPGDIIVAKKAVFYDFGTLDSKGKFHIEPGYMPNSVSSGKNIKRTPLFFKSNSKLLDLALKAGKNCKFNKLSYKGKEYSPSVMSGIITSTETFNEFHTKTIEMIKATNCIAFDMECAAVAQVCYNQHIPFLAIKAISDNGNFAMYNALKNIAAYNAEILVESMLK